MPAPTVAVLRSQDRSAELAAALAAAGAVPVLCPLIANELPASAEERDQVREQLQLLADGAYAWVAFTAAMMWNTNSTMPARPSTRFTTTSSIDGRIQPSTTIAT